MMSYDVTMLKFPVILKGSLLLGYVTDYINKLKLILYMVYRADYV